MIRMVLLVLFLLVPTISHAAPPARQMDRLLSEARAELAALDSLVESAHSPAVRVEMHRKARRIDELMWQVQNLVHGGTASLGPGPAPVMGVVVTGPGGEQASAHVGGVGVTVQVDEIGGMVLVLECHFVANFFRCLVLRVREGESADQQERRLQMEERREKDAAAPGLAGVEAAF